MNKSISNSNKIIYNKTSNYIFRNLKAWLFLLPAFIFISTFTIYPIFKSIWYGLHQFEMGMSKPVFIGLNNYKDLVSSPLFWKVMRNTFKFALLTVIPSMILGLFLATIVNKKSRVIGFMRTSFFYPVVMPMIAIASIWMFIYMPNYGLLDHFLYTIGHKPLNVLSNKKTVIPALSIMYIWREAGYVMIFFLSGLQNISSEILEAAKIDGANNWTVFRKITFPLIMPTVLFVSTIALTDSVKLVDHIVMMTEGAPNNASTLLLYYIYQQGFIYFDQGKASSLTVIMLVIMLTISMIQFINTDRRIYYS